MSQYRILASMQAGGPVAMTTNEYIIGPGEDVGLAFAAMPSNVQAVYLSGASTYYSAGDIVMPRRGLFTVHGCGAKLNLGANSNGFTNNVTDQSDALTYSINHRWIIEGIQKITGGQKAINISGTYNTVIDNMELASQSVAAIDMRFALMSKVSNILVTNPGLDGIRMRIGDWSGANWANSQSNCSTMSQCRIYCSPTTDKAFYIQHSSEMVIRDSIVEGSPSNHDIYVTTQGNTNSVVKNFKAENCHFEHASNIASVYIDMPSSTATVLDNVYWGVPPNKPAVLFSGGNIVMRNIGWFSQYARIVTRAQSPRITIYDSHPSLGLSSVSLAPAYDPNDPTNISNAIQGNTVLTPAYVRVSNTLI